MNDQLYSLCFYFFSTSPPLFRGPEFIRFAGKIGKQRFFPHRLLFRFYEFSFITPRAVSRCVVVYCCLHLYYVYTCSIKVPRRIFAHTEPYTSKLEQYFIENVYIMIFQYLCKKCALHCAAINSFTINRYLKQLYFKLEIFMNTLWCTIF